MDLVTNPSKISCDFKNQIFLLEYEEIYFLQAKINYKISSEYTAQFLKNQRKLVIHFQLLRNTSESTISPRLIPQECNSENMDNKCEDLSHGKDTIGTPKNLPREESCDKISEKGERSGDRISE